MHSAHRNNGKLLKKIAQKLRKSSISRSVIRYNLDVRYAVKLKLASQNECRLFHLGEYIEQPALFSSATKPPLRKVLENAR